MSQRDVTLLRLRDTLERLLQTQQQLVWMDDNATSHLLTEQMLRDLDCCRRLCDYLHERARPRQSA